MCFTSRDVFMVCGRQSSERIPEIERDDEWQVKYVHADSVRTRTRRDSNNINNKSIYQLHTSTGCIVSRSGPQRLRRASSRRGDAEKGVSDLRAGSEYIEFKLSLVSSRGHKH